MASDCVRFPFSVCCLALRGPRPPIHPITAALLISPSYADTHVNTDTTCMAERPKFACPLH